LKNIQMKPCFLRILFSSLSSALSIIFSATVSCLSDTLRRRPQTA